MTMADIVNGNDNATDSNVIGKVFSSYTMTALSWEEIREVDHRSIYVVNIE